MGAVYQAFDHELGVAVAIKVIRPAAQSDATAARDLEQRFKRELVLARQVTHKYVVRIHDLGEIDGIKYLTMPFVEGETLAEMLRRAGTLPVPRALRIARQVAQGLAAAHEKGVVHRDLKPENIMIEAPSTMTALNQPAPDAATTIEPRRAIDGGDALIMDFGIARSVEHGSTQTVAGSVIGTLEYMAPEQAQGAKVDQRADQYAFGLILYDMLVGRQRVGERDNPMTELLSRLSSPPPSPRTLKPTLPEALDRLVMRCLQASATDRFATTAELVDALDQLTPDGHLRSHVDDAGGAAAADRPVSRSWWQAASAAVLVVAVGAGAGWLVSNRLPTPPVTSAADRTPITVLVADFENRTNDPVFDGVVEQALGLGIEGASFITSFPRRDALRAAAVISPGSRLDEQTARLVAQREGVGLVLAGAIEPRASGYHITARALQPASDGQVLHTAEADAAGKAQVLETVGALAGQVRLALGDTQVPATGQAASETFTAASLEAAKAYTQAQELQFAGRIEEAIAKYEETIRLDPNMGRAYSGLATQYLNTGRRADAERYYKEALARLDRMTDREKFRTRGSYYLFTSKSQEAVREYTALVTAFPADSTGLANLAFAHAQQRDFGMALELGRKASAIFPQNAGRRNNVALYGMYAGRFEEAIADSDAVLKMNPSFVKAYVARGLSELGLGRPADAVATFTRLTEVSPVGASFAAAGLADAALYEGRTSDALTILNDGIAADAAAKNASGVALKRVALADAWIARGDPAAAGREAELAIAADQSTPVALLAGLVLARTGKTVAALAIADTLGDQLETDPQAYARLVRAEVALAQRQARTALDHARAAQAIADTWLGRMMLARTYIELGAFAEATSALDAAQRRSGEAAAVALDDVPTFRYFAPLHYYRGIAQAGLKSPGARSSFETFLAIKKDGDETGGLVADARKRLP
jgi:tetratricopeptide (TPR) repeat protein